MCKESLIGREKTFWEVYLAGQLNIFTSLLLHQVLVIIPGIGIVPLLIGNPSAYLLVLVRSIQRPIFTLKAFMDWKSMVGLNLFAGGTWSS